MAQFRAASKMVRTWAWWVGLLAALAGARELDPAACASRFDVQKDKIIRTEESQEMGARYLSELDVGTRHECLRLCCETDACDVFVYEEKGSGSCYLFNCGPPEDFRCKFTAHGNFSSGVLAISRHLAELQDQERLAHHEQELANLRVVTSTTTPRPSSTSTAPPRPSPSPRLPQPAPDPPPRHRCSRYQFECHTGGECIAVYNACDGVPQCADGSDEAPELGCPSAPPLEPLTPTTSTTTPATVKMAQSLSGAASPAEAAAEVRWPHRLTQAAAPRRYVPPEPPSSHIFSHKGGLLQDTDTNPMSPNMVNQYPAFEAPWQQRRPWMQPAGQGMEGMSERGWAGGGGGFPHYEWAEPDPRRAWPVPQQRPDQVMPVYMPPKTMPETANVFPNQHSLHDAPKKGFELMKQVPAEPATAPPPELKPEPKEQVAESTSKKKELKIEPTTTVRAPAPAVAAAGAAVAVAHAHYAPDDRDGPSDAPPAALMLLVLGVLMTTATGVMLACRARAARRRRRGKSYAHDADYLVNGMYL